MYTNILFNNLVILAIYDPYSRKTRRSKFLNITQCDCSSNIVQDYAKIYSCGGSLCQFLLQFYQQLCLFPYHVILWWQALSSQINFFLVLITHRSFWPDKIVHGTKKKHQDHWHSGNDGLRKQHPSCKLTWKLPVPLSQT